MRLHPFMSHIFAYLIVDDVGPRYINNCSSKPVLVALHFKVMAAIIRNDTLPPPRYRPP